MNRHRMAAAWIGIALGVVAAPGCSPPKEGQPEFGGFSRSVESRERVALRQLLAATLAAFEEMQLRHVRKETDALYARVSAWRSDESEIIVTLRHVDEATTDIAIRAGLLGDEKVSRIMYDTIIRNLPEAAKLESLKYQ